jgi:hypothetical protein
MHKNLVTVLFSVSFLKILVHMPWLSTFVWHILKSISRTHIAWCVLNVRMARWFLNFKFGRMWKEVVMGKLKVVINYWPGEPEENHKNKLWLMISSPALCLRFSILQSRNVIHWAVMFGNVSKPFGTGIKCLVWCAEDKNLNESCIRRPLNGHDLYLTYSILSVMLCDGCTWC